MSNFPLGLTFDDVLLVPRESAVRPTEVDLTARLTKRRTLAAPLLSAAMDTVTEVDMAIALAHQGCLGILHRNCTIAEQVKMVKQVAKLNLTVGAAVGPHDLER